MLDQIHLTVMADDFGVHSAVNEGIADSFVNGLLTDANVMTPCEGFDESIQLSKQHNLPVGLHSTFSCDFDRYRWGPLTDMKTMVDEKGFFFDKTARAWQNADLEEARKEQDAQHQKLLDCGVTITHISEHMGVDDGGVFFQIQQELAERTGVPHRLVSNPIFKDTPVLQYNFDGQIRCSCNGRNLETRKARLKEKLFAIKSGGYYIWIVHPAMDHAVLDTFQTPDTDVFVWGRLYRVLDYQTLVDPEVKEWVEQLNIKMTPVSEVPFSKATRKF